MSQPKQERFFSVDVETVGPIPGEYSLLSLGACMVMDDVAASPTFSCCFQPISLNADPKALEISGFSLEELKRDGMPPAEAMYKFATWISQNSGEATPVFVGFNAPFDWSFVNYYFHLFIGHNPFGFSALDIKSLYMGVAGCSWHDTRSSAMSKILQPTRRGNHNALDDALAQAELFQLVKNLSVKKM